MRPAKRRPNLRKARVAPLRPQTKIGYLRARSELIVKLYKRGYNSNEIGAIFNKASKKTGFTFSGNNIYLPLLDALGASRDSMTRSKRYYQIERIHLEARERLQKQGKIRRFGRVGAEAQKPLTNEAGEKGEPHVRTSSFMRVVPRGERVRTLETKLGHINLEINAKKSELARAANSSDRHLIEEDLRTLLNQRTPLVRERNALLGE